MGQSRIYGGDIAEHLSSYPPYWALLFFWAPPLIFVVGFLVRMRWSSRKADQERGWRQAALKVRGDFLESKKSFAHHGIHVPGVTEVMTEVVERVHIYGGAPTAKTRRYFTASGRHTQCTVWGPEGTAYFGQAVSTTAAALVLQGHPQLRQGAWRTYAAQVPDAQVVLWGVNSYVVRKGIETDPDKLAAQIELARHIGLCLG